MTVMNSGSSKREPEDLTQGEMFVSGSSSVPPDGPAELGPNKGLGKCGANPLPLVWIAPPDQTGIQPAGSG